MKVTTSKLVAVISITLFAGGLASLHGGEFDIGILPPIGKVGPIGKVAGIGKDPAEGTRPADTGYIVSWTWSMAQEPKWRSTKKYSNLQEARDFASYQNWRYDKGQAVFMAVNKKDWDDPETRKKIMERIYKEAIPSALERAAGKVELNNPEQAARLRKQIKFVQPEWVDVKPVLSRDSKEYKALKAGEVQAAKPGGYDDGGIVPMGLKLENTVWRIEGGDVKYHLLPEGKLLVTYGGGKDAGFKSCKWSKEGDVVRIDMGSWNHEATPVSDTKMNVVRKVGGKVAVTFTIVRE